MAGSASNPAIEHIFVLALENRSFDHMLAYSGIEGIAHARPSDANEFHDRESGRTVRCRVGGAGAPWTMPSDPGHEFADVLLQLGGPDVQHEPWTPYPTTLDNSGFVASYATSSTESEPGAPAPPPLADIGDIMHCFDTPNQLPVLHQLATEFAVCDHWFSSIPGPTWPNRLFLHGASSGGWTNSPSGPQLEAWYEKKSLFALPNGSIFDRLTTSHLPWRIYADQDGPQFGGVPMVAALANIVYRRNTLDLATFRSDVSSGDYDAAYTFIEPNYGDVVHGSFAGGSSQHPTDGVTRGEALIKATYEAIRQSPLWERSLLIITWDEHGGFYDSVTPPTARPPDDGSPNDPEINSGGFLFDRLGVRVPAVVVSPLVPRGSVDSTVFDHSSVPATIERQFGLEPMTARDASANDLLALCSLTTPRADCPTALAPPAAAPPRTPPPPPDPNQAVTHPAGLLRMAVLRKSDVETARDTEERDAAHRAHAAVRTVAEANAYADGAVARINARLDAHASDHRRRP